MKLTSEYIEGFVGVCAEVGLSEKQASVLLEVAAAHLDLKDPEFAEGFKTAMEKAAFQAPDLTGAFSAVNPDLARGATGAGWGALAGAGLGAASLLRPSIGRGAGGKGLLAKLNPKLKGFLNPAAMSRNVKMVPNVGAAVRNAGKGLPGGPSVAMGWKPKLEGRLHFAARRLMGPDTKKMMAYTGLGAGAGAGINMNQNLLSGYGSNMPALDQWLPDNMSPDGVRGRSQPGAPGAAQAGGSFGGNRRPPSPYDPVSSFDVNGAGAVGGAVGGAAASPLDQRMSALESQMDRSGTIDAALHNNRIRKQMADLERQRVRENADASIHGGRHSAQMARAGNSIAEKLKQVTRAIETREGRAGNAAAFMERNGGPTTLSNFLPQMLGKALGTEAGGQQISAELQELYRARQVLNQQLAQAGQN